MVQILAEQKSRYQELLASYEALLSDSQSENDISDEEKTVLDRIAGKLGDIRNRLDAAIGQPADASAPDTGAQARKMGRIGKLKDMQSSISGLMAALKAAR